MPVLSIDLENIITMAGWEDVIANWLLNGILKQPSKVMPKLSIHLDAVTIMAVV